ncbi:AMP-activated serine/threonine-protein kinase regulatory subunit [Malassezia vespertilionis]|uniref:Snf4p n=1 Tax=Malassezia vespertilionis TaxID=2020962 RepID=A0A2N1JGX3_9BASI|nr:AMP-activated serine/threonine-protein kinase regulatory subunit [Malassezia vespertilionis]PKI85801.1 Snf4p [Malassezia vespertilionis]WFD05355.1 AMP-activated serine/threonine-protein kinase regulatory subunit [Malassezia vespertilionis]
MAAPYEQSAQQPPGSLGDLSNDAASNSCGARRALTHVVQLKDIHLHALHAIRHFLRTRSSYDVLPVSFRLVVLDTKLTIRSALDVMFRANVVSAPTWRSTLAEDDPASTKHDPSSSMYESRADGRPGFSGMITVNDIIHLIQYYYHTASNYDSASLDLETLRLERLREIEQTLDVPPPPLLWIGPLRSLAEAGEVLVRTHARRIPLLDQDEKSGIETVVSVLTQYRLLKFIAMNCRETSGLRASIGSLGIGTFTYAHLLERRRRTPHARLRMGPPPPDHASPYWPLQTATLDTTVFDVVHMFSEKGISAVPILDDAGDVVDLYESVDVITLLRTGAYYQLDLTIRQALERRPADYGDIACCTSDDSLANIFALLKLRRVHRVLVLEPQEALSPLAASPTPAPSLRRCDSTSSERMPIPTRAKGKLVGLLCLSDVLRYIIGSPQGSANVGNTPASSSTPTTAQSSENDSPSLGTPP